MDGLELAAIIAGVLGLAVGSFLNVVIYRVPRHESVVSPSSHCPRCETVIKNRHNVPVLGWLALRGRCASCRLPISARYPLVEAATGALFVVITLWAGVSPALPAYLFLASVGIALAAIDFDGLPLPEALTVPAYLVGVALLVASVATGDGAVTTIRALVGLLGFAGGYVVCARMITRRPDPRVLALTAAVGALVGAVSWAALAVGAVSAAVLTAGAALLARWSAGLVATPVALAVTAAAWGAVLILGGSS